MTTHRPILISVAQYEDRLQVGACTVFDVIESAHRLGADGVELRRETWANWQNELTQARTRIEELGLLVTYATHVTLFSPDEAGQETLRQDIDAAHVLGSPLLRIFPGLSPTDDQDPAWEAARRMADYAASQNVTLALENYVSMPGGTLAEIERALTLIPSPALGTNIDIGNYNAHGQDILQAIDAVGHRALSTHIKDKTATLGEPPTYLGGGVLPLRPILERLDSLPQPLIYCFEFRGGDDPEERIRTSMRYLGRG